MARYACLAPPILETDGVSEGRIRACSSPVRHESYLCDSGWPVTVEDPWLLRQVLYLLRAGPGAAEPREKLGNGSRLGRARGHDTALQEPRQRRRASTRPARKSRSMRSPGWQDWPGKAEMALRECQRWTTRATRLVSHRVCATRWRAPNSLTRGIERANSSTDEETSQAILSLANSQLSDYVSSSAVP